VCVREHARMYVNAEMKYLPKMVILVKCSTGPKPHHMNVTDIGHYGYLFCYYYYS
jgi:hypothetical protein